jgi:hypothetical protein
LTNGTVLSRVAGVSDQGEKEKAKAWSKMGGSGRVDVLVPCFKVMDIGSPPCAVEDSTKCST